MPRPAPQRKYRVYPPELKAEAQALALMTGSNRAAAEALNVPEPRISNWLKRADSGDIRNFIQAKGLEAAAEIAARVPGLIDKLIKRAEQVLDDDSLNWNGTQLQAAATMVGITIDQGRKYSGDYSGSSRYGIGGDALEQHPVLPELPVIEHARARTRKKG